MVIFMTYDALCDGESTNCNELILLLEPFIYKILMQKSSGNVLLLANNFKNGICVNNNNKKKT